MNMSEHNYTTIHSYMRSGNRMNMSEHNFTTARCRVVIHVDAMLSVSVSLTNCVSIVFYLTLGVCYLLI